MNSIKDRLQEDIKVAMKEGKKEEVLTLRSLHAAIRKQEIDTQLQLDDPGVIAIVSKQVKTRLESIEAFQKGGRDDLVINEQFEVDILYRYLPKQLSEEEIEAHVVQAVLHCNATTVKDMGKVMQYLRDALAGTADMQKVSSLVKNKLTS